MPMTWQALHATLSKYSPLDERVHEVKRLCIQIHVHQSSGQPICVAVHLEGL
jgi:hypothetical protein